MRYETGGYTEAIIHGGGGLADATKSTGWLQFTAIPLVGETVTLDGSTYTFDDGNGAWDQSRLSNQTGLTGNKVHIGTTPQESALNLHAFIHSRDRLVTNNLYVTLTANSDTLEFHHRKCGDNNTYVTTNNVTGAIASGATLANGAAAGAGRFRPCRGFMPAATGNLTVFIPDLKDLNEPHFDGGDVKSRCPTGASVILPGLLAGTIYPISIAGSAAGVVALY